MPIEPAQLAGSLGALSSLDVDQGLDVTLQQVLRSATTLLDADRAVLMLVDQAGALRWASASGPGGEAVAGALSMPVEVGGGPVGTLDVYVGAPSEWADSAVQRREATDLAVRCTAGTRSCTRARPDGTSGAASLAEPRPSGCRRPRRVAGSSTPKPNSAEPTNNRRRPPQDKALHAEPVSRWAATPSLEGHTVGHNRWALPRWLLAATWDRGPRYLGSSVARSRASMACSRWSARWLRSSAARSRSSARWLRWSAARSRSSASS
jgi:hypothetical protein